MSTAQTVIFLHIPKTAGTTLYRIIERQYKPGDVYAIGGTAQSFDTFKNLPEADKAAVRLLKGHIDFGVHALLPQPATYFTILRDPVERIVSYYHFVRRTPEHYCHELVTSKGLSLAAFLDSKADVMANNGQTRMIAGQLYGYPFGECPDHLLETAKQNLRRHFAVVGLTERFDETLLCLKRSFGWRNLFYARENVAPARQRPNRVDEATRAAIVAANRLDMELYHEATACFDAALQQYGAPFIRQLKQFQAANRLLSPFIHAYGEMKKRTGRLTPRRR
jgi:hypothetical protein